MTELRGLPVAFRTLAYCRPKLKREWESAASDGLPDFGSKAGAVDVWRTFLRAIIPSSPKKYGSAQQS
jgi:hypothetical protein